MIPLSLRLAGKGLRWRLRKVAVTFAGVAFAVAALVVLESIMIGVGDTMIRNAVEVSSGHVHAEWPAGVTVADDLVARAEAIPSVRAALRRNRAVGTLAANNNLVPVTLRGVDPDRERSETIFADTVTEGEYLSRPGDLLIGSHAAARLGLSVGDEVSFLRGPLGPLEFRVGGIFSIGSRYLDEKMGFVRREDLPDGDGLLTLFLENPEVADAAAAALADIAPPQADVMTWEELLPELVQLIGLNRVSMNVVLTLALLILAFGVANTVFVSVSERTREFGVMLAMGARPWGLIRLVLAETFMLVCAAGLAGVALGAGVSALWAQWGLDLSRWTSKNPYFIVSGVVYPRLTVDSLILPLVVAAICGLLAGWFPARRAGRINVVDALRNL